MRTFVVKLWNAFIFFVNDVPLGNSGCCGNPGLGTGNGKEIGNSGLVTIPLDLTYLF